MGWQGEQSEANVRLLLTVRFEKRHDAYLEEELGKGLRAARTASGGRARLECSRTHFLRSLCKLTHKGYGQYVKGDAMPFLISWQIITRVLQTIALAVQIFLTGSIIA